MIKIKMIKDIKELEGDKDLAEKLKKA